MHIQPQLFSFGGFIYHQIIQHIDIVANAFFAPVIGAFGFAFIGLQAQTGGGSVSVPVAGGKVQYQTGKDRVAVGTHHMALGLEAVGVVVNKTVFEPHFHIAFGMKLQHGTGAVEVVFDIPQSVDV